MNMDLRYIGYEAGTWAIWHVFLSKDHPVRPDTPPTASSGVPPRSRRDDAVLYPRAGCRYAKRHAHLREEASTFGSSLRGLMGTRILVALEDEYRAYREVLAAGVKSIRPGTQVAMTLPALLEE